MCGGVCATDAGAAVGVHLGADMETFAEFAFEQVADVDPEIAVLLGVDDVEFEAIGGERTGVADLSAGFGIEGAAIEGHSEGFSVADFGEFRDQFATGDNTDDTTFGMQAVVAHEAGAALFLQ